MPHATKSDPAPGDPDGYALAFSESVRDLEHQERSVDELRSRAGTLLAASSIATSFLAAAALPKDKPWDWPVWVALAAFAIGIGLCIWVLWPRDDWVFVNDASKVIGGYVEGDPPASIAEIHKGLAQDNNRHSNENAEKLKLLYRGFASAAFLLFVQVIAWLIVLWGGTAHG